MMKAAAILALVLFAFAAAAASSATDRQAAAPNASRCGGPLWRMKTFADTQRNLVNVLPRPTTIAAIGERPYPRPTPRRRRTPFQRQAWEVVAQITAFRLDGGELRLILFDGGAYMNAVIPVPECLARQTRARAELLAAWKQFQGSCDRVTRGWKSLGAIMYVSGLGFWSQRSKMRRGQARNGAELHPVTRLRVVAGCSR